AKEAKYQQPTLPTTTTNPQQQHLRQPTATPQTANSQQLSRLSPTRCAINDISPIGSMNIGRHIEICASTISA
ncbi:MAG: hypothetical protein ACI4L2_04985, partial [Wujia sp.]